MKLIKALFVVIIALVIGNVTLANRSVDEGILVSDLTNEINSLQNQNTILRSDVASAGSLSSMATRIEEAGFVVTPKIASVQTGASVASR